MKKTSKILSGSLLVALMAFGLVKGNPVEKTGGLQVRDVLAEDVTKDVAGRIVRKADGEAPVANGKVSEVKAQVSEEVEGKRHIRFVAAIDSYAYDAGYFDVTFKNGEEVVKTWEDQRVSYVYEAIEVEGEALTPADLFAKNSEEYASFEGCNYFIAFTVNNVPQAYWETTIEVSASVTSGETVYEKVAEKTVQEVIDADKEYKHETLNLSGNWNPHGDGFLVFAWSNSGLTNDIIVERNVVAIIDGVEYSFKFDRIDGAMAAFFQCTKLGTGIGSANYTLVVEFKTNDTIYSTSVEVVNGQKYTLDKAKTDYTKNLNNYLANNNLSSSNYTEENWELVQGYINAGLEAINAATNVADVKTAYNNAVSLIAEVEQRDLSLDETISQAKEQLTAYAATKNQADYSEENWTLIQSLLTEGLAAIEACESETDVTSTLDSYKNQIDAIEGIAIPLTFGHNWNPHGTYYLIFGWTNENVNNQTIDQESISIVLTTEDGTYTGQFICFDGAIHIKVFFQNLPSDIAKTSFTLTVEFTANGDSYAGTLSFDGTNKPY